MANQQVYSVAVNLTTPSSSSPVTSAAVTTTSLTANAIMVGPAGAAGPAGPNTVAGLITAGTNVTLTGSGTSGSPYVVAATGGSGSGTVTSASVVSANGLAGTVATPTTTPAITLSTTVNGVVKGNGTALSAATSGTDYAPGTSGNTTGIVKSTTGTGALTTAVASDFPTLNQSTTGNAATVTTNANLTGDVTSVGNATTYNNNLPITKLNSGTSASASTYWRGDGTWSTPAGSSPLTTKGDLFGYSTANARLPVGTDGQALLADSTQTLGIKWGAVAAAFKNLNTLRVAASTATTAEKASADYVCTGTADDVQINAALTAVSTAGGIVELGAGTFNLAATLAITGTGVVDTSPNIALVGKGSASTIIKGAANTHVITITNMPKPKIQDVWLIVDGTGDGVHCTANTTGTNDRRGFWQGDFANIFCSGSGINTHSGWVLNLESPFRSIFRDIQTGSGIANGIWLKSTYASFNPGNCVFMACQMGLSIANGTAYYLQSADTGGFLNIMTFIECDAFDGGASTTSIGWKFKGSGTTYYTTRDMLVLRSNVEQFNTAVRLDHAANIEANLNFVQSSATSGKIFDLTSDSVNNYLSVQYAYVPSPITTAAITDLNTDVLKPNHLWKSFARVETGGTLTVTKSAATLLEKLARDSDGSGVYPTEWQAQATGLITKNAGTELFRGTRSINFTGAGVTATNSSGDITVTIAGGSGSGISRSVNNISTATTAGATAATDYVYLVSGTTTLTLPTAVGNTNQYTIKITGVATVTIATTSSQTIDGSTTVTIKVQYQAITVVSDNANWNII